MRFRGELGLFLLPILILWNYALWIARILGR